MALHAEASIFQLEFHGFSLKYSPFDGRRLAVATSQYFGIAGNGKQYILDIDPLRGACAIQEQKSFYTQEGLFDCSWSEINSSQVCSACADGSVLLWDIQVKDGYPIRRWHEHSKECSGVDWNLYEKTTFLSSSWDKTAKLWHPLRQTSIGTFRGHSHCVYAVSWSPRHNSIFATVSGDHTLKIWDTSSRFELSILAHEHEVLTVDWSKYEEFVIATSGADKSIKFWDIRLPSNPMKILEGHSFPIKRIRFDPHNSNILGSASYDLSVRIWQARSDALGGNLRYLTVAITQNLCVELTIIFLYLGKLRRVDGTKLFVHGCGLKGHLQQ
eukprot:GSMAST32.ASY1.ANO1.1286.1 assembled CDS